MPNLQNKIALVTGASRGMGAAVARLLAEAGADVAINYRNKAARAEVVAATVREAGRRAWIYGADLTIEQEVTAMLEGIRHDAGRLDTLILNASGGLEKDRAADYALQLNRDAQLFLLEAALSLLAPGGRVVFVTSHLAHFHGRRPVYPAYEPVAASKQAGEAALREKIPQLAAHGLELIVVSGDMIEGTITPKLMERTSPGLIASRRARAGALPTIEEFATAIVNATTDPQLKSGDTVFVGRYEG